MARFAVVFPHDRATLVAFCCEGWRQALADEVWVGFAALFRLVARSGQLQQGGHEIGDVAELGVDLLLWLDALRPMGDQG